MLGNNLTNEQQIMIQLTTKELNAERLRFSVVECPWCYHPVATRFELEQHLTMDCTEIEMKHRLAIIRKEV